MSGQHTEEPLSDLIRKLRTDARIEKRHMLAAELEIKLLKEQRDDVCLALCRDNPGGVHFDDMPRLVHALIEQRDELLAALRRYHGFAGAMLEGLWRGILDDGEDVQSEAERAGIISKVPGGFDPSKHCDASGVCSPGDDFYMQESETGELIKKATGAQEVRDA